MLFQLPGDEVTLGDLQFLRLGVAGQVDHFESIAKGRMDWIQPVGGGDEQNTG